VYFLISLLDPKLKKSGYVCVPYTHDEDSLKLKSDWISSRNIKSIYFVTATFSEDSKSYFPSSTSHYLMAKFKDSEKIIKETIKNKIRFLTLYAFSTENWKRPKKEINFLFNLLQNFLLKKTNQLNKEQIKLKIIGNKKIFSKKLKKTLLKSEKITNNNNK